MKVLVVMPGLSRDAGAERSLLAMAPGLVAAGLELHVALLTDRQEPLGELTALGVVAHDLSAHTGFLPRVRAIRALVGRIRPDVVHATLVEATLPTQVAAIGTGVGVLVSWVGTSYSPERYAEVGSSAWKLRLIQLFDALVGRLSGARYHAVTRGVATVNSAALRVATPRVMVGERGREEPPERPDEAALDRIRADLGLPSASGVVLAVGRQDVVKGYDSLIEAFDRVAAVVPEAVLLVAGRAGTATRRLEQRLAELPHRDRIRFLGHRDDVATLMHLADVVVCASTREGAAGSLIEAMACSRPIVSVPLPGLADVLTDGYNALVVERPRLADGLERVLGEAGLAERLGKGGRATFEERFTLERSVEQMVEIYRFTAQRGSRR